MRQYAHPDVEVALAQQGAEVIVKIQRHFIHLIGVGVHWKHAPTTVGHLQAYSNKDTSSSSYSFIYATSERMPYDRNVLEM